jgi:predicted ATPase
MLTSFVGRDRPVHDVAGLLEECRLVTVTGPGGAGKTRLADQVARRVADRFADGAWLVELAQVQDPAQVVAAVAAALEVREQPGLPAEQVLAQVLARQQVLLVIDNCEHVIGEVARLCAGLLAACDDVRVLAATVEWSYLLLDDHQWRVFRRLSVFPGPFTLEAAEAVAGAGSGPAVLHLVDCSLLSPPQAGPDGRARYQMLETLQAHGAQLLAGAGEHEDAVDALARYAVVVAEQAAAGLQTNTPAEGAAARWLDAEDATMRTVLARALDNDPATAARLAAALGWWWSLRGQLAARYALLREITARAETGSDAWCTT